MRWNRREFLQTSVAALGVAPFAPFAQGRNCNRKDTKSEVEIFAECALLH